MSEPEKFIRYIEIDNLKVGYDYPKKQFYISNKNTTTYRGDIEYIFTILQDVFNISLSPELQAQIQDCKDKEELLGTTDSLSYLWSTDGSYIYSIQFNEWESYPLILEAEKAILRIEGIDGSVTDLKSNEDIRTVVAPKLCSFYKETLGLTITLDQMVSICNFLLYFYKPTCINLIAENEDSTDTELRYSNKFKLTNYSNTSIAEYTCTNDPLNTPIPTDIGYITSIDTTTRTITLLNPIESDIIEEYNIKVGSKIYIEGTKILIDEEYTDDGTYTIQAIKDNTIVVEEELPTDYEFPYYTCYVKTGNYIIQAISRETNTITLSDTPSNILVGDKITVENADITLEFEEIKVNGTYTVQGIQGNVITVYEDIPTTYTYSITPPPYEYADNTASLYKEVFISAISEINESVITLLNSTTYNLLSCKVICYNNSISKQEFEVVGTTQDSEDLYSTLTLNNILEAEEGYPNYPKVQYPLPSEDTMVDVTKVNEGYEDIFPVGQFILDTFEEADKYISLCPTLIKPSDMSKTYEETGNLYTRDIEDNLYRKVAESLEILIVVYGELNYRMTAKCLGCKPVS